MSSTAKPLIPAITFSFFPSRSALTIPGVVPQWATNILLVPVTQPHPSSTRPLQSLSRPSQRNSTAWYVAAVYAHDHPAAPLQVLVTPLLQTPRPVGQCGSVGESSTVPS